VGVRIAEQVVEYLSNGVALNAVNMPSLSPEQYRALGPYIELAEGLGAFASYIATGNRARAADLFRQDRRRQHQPVAQRQPGRFAEPFEYAQGQRGQFPANGRTPRLERGGSARESAPSTPIPSGSRWRPTRASPLWKALCSSKNRASFRWMASTAKSRCPAT